MPLTRSLPVPTLLAGLSLGAGGKDGALLACCVSGTLAADETGREITSYSAWNRKCVVFVFPATCDHYSAECKQRNSVQAFG